MCSEILKIVILFGCVFGLTLSTTVYDCESGIPLPKLVEVDGCSEPPCPLVRGTNSTAKIHFIAQEPLEEIRARVVAVVEGATVPYPLPQPNGCILLNTHCPLEINEPATFLMSVPVSTLYPLINVRMIFTMTNQKKGEQIFCFTVPCEVVNP